MRAVGELKATGIDPNVSIPTPMKSGRIRKSPWVDFAIRRGSGFVATVVVLVVATFCMVRLIPGDAAVAAAGPDATPEQVEAVRAQLGLDTPWPHQFLAYVQGLVHADLGTSFAISVPVRDYVFARLPYTAALAVIAIILVLAVAVPLGMSVGVLTRGGRRRWLDQAFGFLTGLLSAVPGYVIATLLVVAFSVNLSIFPPAYSHADPVSSFTLPTLALAVGPISLISRVVRRETSVILEHDFVRTARGWRLGRFLLYRKYVLPSLMTSTLTLSGLVLTSMLGSAIVVETVFGWPGLGLGTVQAIVNRDYPVIQGIVLVIGVLAALLNLMVDIMLGLIDPRTLGGRQ